MTNRGVLKQRAILEQTSPLLDDDRAFGQMVLVAPGLFGENDSSTPARPETQPRGRKRMRIILDASEYLLSQIDTDDLTHILIAAQSGVSRTSIYQYFPRITDILMALTARYGDLHYAALTAAYKERQPKSLEEAVECIVDMAVTVFNGNTAMRRVTLVSGGRARNFYDRDYNKSYAQKLRELIGKLAPNKTPAGDPMEVIAMTAYSIYALAVLRDGYITEFYRDRAKRTMLLQLQAEQNNTE